MSGVLQSALIGGGLALAAAMQPGPLQAFLVSRAVTAGWRAALPACFSPLVTDGPIALAVLLVLGQLSHRTQNVLRTAGGALLIVFAWQTVARLRRPGTTTATASAPRTLFEAAAVNLLNPSPYLGWALVLGPAVVAAWRADRANAVALVTAFYAIMVVTLVAFVVAVASVGVLGPRARRIAGAASAMVLAIIGALLLATGLRDLSALP
jgi:threonine/homoserine/homoserine lactone efflux protein